MHTQLVLDYDYMIQREADNEHLISVKSPIRYGLYKAKSISSSIEYTPNGLIVINLKRQPEWPEKLGLVLSFEDKEGFQISGFKTDDMSERLGLFEVKEKFLK